MLLHLVVLLSLSWPHVIGTGKPDLQDELALDQIATASENVAQSAAKFEQKRKEFRDQLIPSIVDTTVHYENSNGFMPMLPASPSSKPLDTDDRLDAISSKTSNVTWSDSFNNIGNSSSIDRSDEEEGKQGDTVENDPAYSTEARIFLNFPNLNSNRRSFEHQGGRNEFELLKVRNDTPMVANYPDFYEDPPGSIETENKEARKVKAKGQKMADYTGNYGTVSTKSNADRSPFVYYYSQNAAKGKGKNSNEQVKVNNNYHQQDSLSYDGHGQSSTRQHGSATSYPRTNQEVNVFAKTNGDVYDSAASSSQIVKNHQMFSRPVVVAEPNYKFDQSSGISNSNIGSYQTSRIIDSSSSEVSSRYTIDNRDSRFQSDEDSRDLSDEGEYMEYTERPRRVQKSRRRPSSVESSKRLPKEHRGSMDNSMEYESQGNRHHSTRSKPHRHRERGNSWSDDDRHRDQDSYEDTRYDSRLSKFKPNSAWNQVSPNLEISHSSGIEIGQLEKPKLIVPVKVNLVPVANFDHATAIDNSQGFDMSNAVLGNIVSASPVSTISTPLMNTAASVIGQNGKIRVSSPIPDIIIGQNSYHTSIQANEQNKFSSNLKPEYMSSTVSPIFAVTPSMQSISVQDVQASATPRPTYVSASNQLQHLSTNHVHSNVPQLVVPQPTLQTLPTLMQTPLSTADFNIQVNHHGMNGQNPINHGNLQVQAFPTMSTITPIPQTVPVTKISLLSPESQSKKTLFSGSNTNFLASASLAVGQNDQRQPLNGDSYYLQNSNTQQIVKPQVQNGLYHQVLKNVNVAPKKTYVQTTHLLPAVLHPMPTITTLSASTPQVIPEHQYVQGTNDAMQSSRGQSQQYLNIQSAGSDNGISMLKNLKFPSFAFQSMDNVGSHSINSVNTENGMAGVSGTSNNAHLPYVGTRNVEIVNPNIKPSPVDNTVVNSYETLHYPAAVLTTSIPMFTTTSYVTARPTFLATTPESTNVQNLVNSLTEVGSKNNQASTGDLKAYQSQERPVFNPINFVPNMDVVKNQNALNSKLQNSEPLQQNLNLVPLIPGGNFFKPSFSSQSELLVKPKLTSDLETYAEQMFKESLKTIYNSQKWNNDRKPGNNRQNLTDPMDVAKLRNELLRLKASLTDSKRNKDYLEGHQSETKVQTAELPNKRPDELLAALEQMLKNRAKDNLHSSHGNNKPHRYRKPGERDKFNSGSKHIRDFLTPPKPNSHRSKGHFHDKPGKKRPVSRPARFNGHKHHHGPRSNPRQNFSPKTGNLDASSTKVDPVYFDGFSMHENKHNLRPRVRPEFKRGSSQDPYHSFAKSLSDKNSFLKGSKHHKGSADKGNGFNHAKMHNLLGLLMKNKQLPNGSTPSYLQDNDQLKMLLEDEKQRLQQQFYDDTFKDYLHKMSEGTLYSNLGHGASDTRRFSERSKV